MAEPTFQILIGDGHIQTISLSIDGNQVAIANQGYRSANLSLGRHVSNDKAVGTT